MKTADRMMEIAEQERIETIGRWLLTSAIRLELVRRQFGNHDDGFGTEGELIHARALVDKVQPAFKEDAEAIIFEMKNDLSKTVSPEKQFLIDGFIELTKLCTDIQEKITKAIVGVRKLDAFVNQYESKKRSICLN